MGDDERLRGRINVEWRFYVERRLFRSELPFKPDTIYPSRFNLNARWYHTQVYRLAQQLPRGGNICYSFHRPSHGISTEHTQQLYITLPVIYRYKSKTLFYAEKILQRKSLLVSEPQQNKLLSTPVPAAVTLTS